MKFEKSPRTHVDTEKKSEIALLLPHDTRHMNFSHKHTLNGQYFYCLKLEGKDNCHLH